MHKKSNPEQERLLEDAKMPDMGHKFATGYLTHWEKWGPYVSERSWGTVREDYSANGDAWNYFPHDHARKRAYRWSEDGIAGITDRYQILVFAPAFWNGVDAILKERLFGLNSYEGNHGEDVKEMYYHLDATPSHSYLKYLYKYPQAPFPYEELVKKNQERTALDEEYELLDTGIFDENQYFDIFIEYAKASPEDICIKIEVINRGEKEACLHVLPHLWFRNQWAWGSSAKQPLICMKDGCMVADDTDLPSPYYLLFDYHLGPRYLYASPGGEVLFTQNETHREALWGEPNDTPYVKDAFHRCLIQGEKGAVNPQQQGTKAAYHYFFPSIAGGEKKTLLLRFSPTPLLHPLEDVEEIIEKRKKEADAFYETIHPLHATEEEKTLQRQAFAGMIWNKQSYIFDVGTWLNGDDPKHPPPEGHQHIRNIHWRHILSMRVFSMPDKWEYPWFAAWDLTFHALVFSLIDIEFAKHQIWLLLFDQFQHPNGAIPAYEWEFSDVNPPIQAWAILKIFESEKKKTGKEDFLFLEKCFHKLLLNFAWWINKVDSLGHNIFEGGFLGMDNIAFSDRSEKLPPGYLMDQVDGSGWISLLCLNLMRIALMLAKKDPIYEGLGIKFMQHFVYVTASMRRGHWRSYDLWCEEDGFFYSVLCHPNGQKDPIKVRSLTGIVPFLACDVWDEHELKQYPDFYAAYQWMVSKRSHLTEKCIQEIQHPSGKKHIFGLLNQKEMSRFTTYLWSSEEFRSEYGLRSLSKYHEKYPAVLYDLSLSYEPGESKEKIKGGNSNWRGPIWLPINFFLVDTFEKLAKGFQNTFQIKVKEEPPVTFSQMAQSYRERVLNIFKKNSRGHRPMYGKIQKLQEDPHFKDYFLFYEHFHGDNGRGLGASHQNGWTGLVANFIDELREKNDTFS